LIDFQDLAGKKPYASGMKTQSFGSGIKSGSNSTPPSMIRIGGTALDCRFRVGSQRCPRSRGFRDVGFGSHRARSPSVSDSARICDSIFFSSKFIAVTTDSRRQYPGLENRETWGTRLNACSSGGIRHGREIIVPAGFVLMIGLLYEKLTYLG
jgi:hypothetical protein